ncbi:anti-sigma factor [Sagittula sp. NFXS13]|uniref:anti-sigma factor n=1 Tax=Sagittula sp. NFXS13 TaxID=2819095 RepID=UPI0032DFB241
MTDEPLTDEPGEIETQAAEYALGLLSGDERLTFEARMAQDRDLAQDVDAWTEYFVTLTDGMPSKTPPARVLKRIELAVHGAPEPPIWRSLVPYLMGAVGGALIAWAVFMSGILIEAPGDGRIRADLAPAEGQLAFAVLIDPPSHTVSLDLTEGAVPEGRSLEVWLIPAGAEPISLGLATEDGTFATRLSDAMAARVPGATLAVTDEPVGGSPTGAPTGTIQAAGVPIPL